MGTNMPNDVWFKLMRKFLNKIFKFIIGIKEREREREREREELIQGHL